MLSLFQSPQTNASQRTPFVLGNAGHMLRFSPNEWFPGELENVQKLRGIATKPTIMQHACWVRSWICDGLPFDLMKEHTLEVSELKGTGKA